MINNLNLFEMKSTKQVVIRIAQDYTPKNQLHKQIVENMLPLHHNLVSDIEVARDLIKDAVAIAHKTCKTKCKPVDLVRSKYHDFGTTRGSKDVYIISGLIEVHILKLKKS